MSRDDPIAEWNRHPKWPKTPLLEWLFSEDQQVRSGWFRLCQTEANRRDSDQRPDASETILTVYCDGRERPIALAQWRCAELLAQYQARRDRILSQSHWTVEQPPLPDIQAEVLSDIEVGGLLGHLKSHLQAAWLGDFLGQLLGLEREIQDEAFAHFPVTAAGGSGRDGLARFRLQLLKEGSGQAFLDPKQSFLDLDDDFVAIFGHAIAALGPPKGKLGGDVRVGIEWSDGRPLAWNGRLGGGSAGGALLLGLWSLAERKPLEASLYTSFALAPQGGTPDGNCHPVDDVEKKALEIEKRVGQDGVFLVAERQEAGALLQQCKQRLARASSLQQAFDLASGRLKELLAYLDALVAKANSVPPYYPEGARGRGRVPIPVRVSPKRVPFDQKRAKQREQDRLRGIPDDDEGIGARRHRDGPIGEGSGRDEGQDGPRVEVLDWDGQVHGKFRLGIVVGKPGLGKTWLMESEAARYARAACACLRKNRDLAGEGLRLPVCCRLPDIAAALSKRQKPQGHGTDELPALPEAVCASLPSRWLSAATSSYLCGQLGTERCVLLLDGFDEVPAEQRPELLRVLREWVDTNNKARVLFASREVGYEQPWPIPPRSEEVREMELLPFDDAQMRGFVSAFFVGDASGAADEMNETLGRTPHLRGMAQIPLLLGFLCAVHRMDTSRRDWEWLRRTDLYDEIQARLLSGAWRERQQEPVSDPKMRLKTELLGATAFSLFQAGKMEFKMSVLMEAVRLAHSFLCPGEVLKRAELTALIEEWSEKDGLLVRAGQEGATDPAYRTPDPTYQFLHTTFQEHLAACHLADRVNLEQMRGLGGWTSALVQYDGHPVTVMDLVNHKAWLPHWSEVIILLAGKLDDPVPLLEMLSKDADDDVFRHRLTLAALCLPEIKELLAAEGD